MSCRSLVVGIRHLNSLSSYLVVVNSGAALEVHYLAAHSKVGGYDIFNVLYFVCFVYERNERKDSHSD